jgi:hypothetical protein
VSVPAAATVVSVARIVVAVIGGKAITFTQTFDFLTVAHTRDLATSNLPAGLHDFAPFVVSFPDTMNHVFTPAEVPQT